MNYYLIRIKFHNLEILHFFTQTDDIDSLHNKLILDERINFYDIYPLKLTDVFNYEHSSF